MRMQSSTGLRPENRQSPFLRQIRFASLGRMGETVPVYRTFRNPDAPGMVQVWNEAFPGRGEVRLRHSSVLENGVFSKPYFDPKSLFIAELEGQVIGFCHTGFGPNAAQNALDRHLGIINAIAVKPFHQRQGIGSELLRLGEAHLTSLGCKAIYAGGLPPLNPYYFGMIGGADQAGVLDSDEHAAAFWSKNKYRPQATRLIFQRKLNQPINIVDGRFAGLRRWCEVKIMPRSGVGTWWQECVLGPVETAEFRVDEKGTGKPMAWASVWEMDGYSWKWNQPSVGVLHVEVRQDLRRQGLAKFLMTQLLRYLQEQFFAVIEIHLSPEDSAGLKLAQTLGFQQVDKGSRYEKQPG